MIKTVPESVLIIKDIEFAINYIVFAILKDMRNEPDFDKISDSLWEFSKKKDDILALIKVREYYVSQLKS